VNNDHSAVLANFHVASFLPESGASAGVPVSEGDPFSVRWHAPELLFPEEFGLESPRRTKETDVYAFGMVMFEVGFFSPFQPSGPDDHTLSIMRLIPHNRYSLDRSRSRVFGTKP